MAMGGFASSKFDLISHLLFCSVFGQRDAEHSTEQTRNIQGIESYFAQKKVLFPVVWRHLLYCQRLGGNLWKTQRGAIEGGDGIAKIMGDKGSRKRQISKRNRPSKKVTKKAHRIMARTHLSHARLVKIIDSYAHWMTVAEAAEQSGVSRVTVGRMFNLIRKRLLDMGVYQSERSYRELRYDIENEGGGEYFFEEEWRSAFAAFMGRYRGVDDSNRHLYEAEAVFRLNNPLVTAADVRASIMLAIRRSGPLNEECDSELLTLFALEEKVWRQLQETMQFVRALDNGGSIKRFDADRPWITGRPYRVDRSRYR